MSESRADKYFAENKAYAGLGRASLHSGLIVIAARGLNIIVQLASTILLARMLGPHEFGVVATIVALVGFAPMLIDLGTSEAATQRTHITRADVSALFWLNIAIAIVLTALLAGGSGALAMLFGEPSLTGIALVLSTTFIPTALTVQHYALMRRAMQFHKIGLIDVSSNLIGASASIAMAITGWGYWSLVARPVVTAAMAAAFAWMSCYWVPGRPRFSSDVKELVGFGLSVTGFTMTDYLAKSADRLAIGYIWGASALGYFQNAYTIYSNLLGILTEPVHSIATSSLSKLRNDPGELKRSWASALSLLSYFAVPAFAVLAVVGEDLVVLLLGRKWALAGPLLCILAVRGIAHSIERTLGWVHVAVGRADRWMHWGVFSAVFQLAALAVGLPFGIIGVAVAYTIATFALCVPALVFAGSPVGIRTRDVLQAVGPQMVAALTAVGVGYAVQLGMLKEMPQLARVVISGAACLVTYFAVVTGVFRVTGPLYLAFSLRGALRVRR